MGTCALKHAAVGFGTADIHDPVTASYSSEMLDEQIRTSLFGMAAAHFSNHWMGRNTSRCQAWTAACSGESARERARERDSFRAEVRLTTSGWTHWLKRLERTDAPV